MNSNQQNNFVPSAPFQNEQNNNRWNQAGVENVHTFRRRQSPNEMCFFPELAEKRKITDAAFLITFGICVAVLFGFLIYALVSSDIQRFIHGYDSCGNVCGSKNSPVDGVKCSGQDMTDKPILLIEYSLVDYDYVGVACVSECIPPYTVKFHRCAATFDDINFFTNLVGNLNEERVNVFELLAISFGLSLLMLLAFRIFTKEFVWTMIILFLLSLFALTGYFWYLYSTTSDTNGFLYLAIIFTITSVIFALVVLVLTDKIKLIIYFFEEAVQTVFSMPLILLQPALTFISNFITLGLFVYTFALVATSGSLQQDATNPNRYKYVPNGASIFAVCWSVVITFWMVQFILACQQMVISGAIATYYFALDKTAIVSPIYRSFYNLVRFHLGTVSYGSLLIVVLNILKTIAIGLSSQSRGCYRIFSYCFRRLEEFLKYVTSMGYIETAIHGQPLCRSSVRAITLIVHNLLSAIALNNLGALVFFMTKLIVVAATVGIGIGMNITSLRKCKCNHQYKSHRHLVIMSIVGCICTLLSTIIIVFGGIMAFICIHCFFVVFETAVDTIFICYCEDSCMNDGNTNSFLASKELYSQIKKAQAMTIATNAKKK